MSRIGISIVTCETQRNMKIRNEKENIKFVFFVAALDCIKAFSPNFKCISISF